MPEIPGQGIRVLLIGGNTDGKHLLELFRNDPSIHVVGVVDKNLKSPAVQLAVNQSIPVAQSHYEFIRDETLDLIINVTGDKDLQHVLMIEKGPGTVLIGKVSAMLIWTMVDETNKRKILENYLSLNLKKYATHEMVMGHTQKLREIGSMISRVAPTPTTVLIRGESGTGKEMVARTIHQISPWRDSPLVTVNCTAISSSLIESELFGYKKGAFTGATEDRIGLLQMASNGTVFLDEIGDMPLEMQGKLLRFLQSGEIRPVGSFETLRVNVRIIAATNRKLEQAIESGQFRADLFYRLNAFSIELPSLKERKEDINLLTFHFIRNAHQKFNKKVTAISPSAQEALNNYFWPGNIRELKNVIERAVIMCDSNTIELKDLPIKNGKTDTIPAENEIEMDISLGLMQLKEKKLSSYESKILKKYLELSSGNVSRAAESAKVPRRTFQRLLAKHHIDPSEFKI
ncbi:MAG: sigma 54-interacting transcriptional regulator [Calditrichae bacterium]|nr:sigma 54-interacting transcriptional regulator [Calditrichia bacterium]